MPTEESEPQQNPQLTPRTKRPSKAKSRAWRKEKFRTPANKMEVAKVLDLHHKGVTQKEIAHIIGRSRSLVKGTITRFEKVFKHLPNVEHYESHRAKLLGAAEMAVLERVAKQGVIAKADLKDAAYAFEKLHRAGRLERNLSTTNMASLRFTKVHRDEISPGKAVDFDDPSMPSASMPDKCSYQSSPESIKVVATIENKKPEDETGGG